MSPASGFRLTPGPARLPLQAATILGGSQVHQPWRPSHARAARPRTGWWGLCRCDHRPIPHRLARSGASCPCPLPWPPTGRRETGGAGRWARRLRSRRENGERRYGCRPTSPRFRCRRRGDAGLRHASGRRCQCRAVRSYAPPCCDRPSPLATGRCWATRPVDDAGKTQWSPSSPCSSSGVEAAR